MSGSPQGRTRDQDDDNHTPPVIEDISHAIDFYPAAYNGNRLNLLFLDNAYPIRSADDYLKYMDGPGLIQERRDYLLGGTAQWPFPTFSLMTRPSPELLSQRLFERFTEARSLLMTQAEVGTEICKLAQSVRPDVIALMVVDGLSYFDLPDMDSMEPCLVEGPTITQFGFREVIGKPSVSQRVFAMGFRQQLGFSFFGLDGNDLAKDLYAVFASSQVRQIGNFGQCLDGIRESKMARGYIQITAPGLDRLCHHHHDHPPIDRYIEGIMTRFEDLIKTLAEGSRRYLACLTADHGILWREQLPNVELVQVTRNEDAYHPRYLRGNLIREYAHAVSIGGQSHSLLRTPYLTRPLKRTEWGVHGGISAWESIVPFIVRWG